MCQFALAAPAVVTELIGTAQRIPDGAAPIALNKGDSGNDGVITFTFAGRTVEVQRGQAVLTQAGQLTQGTVKSIKKAVEQIPGLNEALESVNTNALQSATQQAAASRQPVSTQNPSQQTCGASCN